MAPKRTHAARCHLPHALKTLKEHDVLGGIGVRHYVGELPVYYKAQGLKDETCREVCEYLLHCEGEERRWYWDKMMTGGATPFQIEKIAAEFRRQSDDMHHGNLAKIRRKEVLVMDASGRLH